MMTSGMYSSAKDDWETPRDLYDLLDREFHFDLDACASQGNAKCARYYTRYRAIITYTLIIPTAIWEISSTNQKPPLVGRLFNWIITKEGSRSPI